MQTQRLYYEDSHMRTFEGTVLDCRPAKKGFDIALHRTCFFPEGGGQYGDRGSLRPLAGGEVVPIRHTHEADGVIWHEADSPLDPGTRVAGSWTGPCALPGCSATRGSISPRGSSTPSTAWTM